MTKRDLAARIAAQTGLSPQDCLSVVQLSFEHIVGELAAGRGVEFRNFGSFHVTKRSPRMGRNPRKPGEEVPIPARFAVKFRPSQKLRERLTKLSDDLPN